MAEIAFNEKVAERFKGPATGQGGIVEFLGFEITDAGPGWMSAKMDVREELITGLTIHGVPIRSIALRQASTSAANSKGDVGRSSSSAAKRRIPSRSIVSCVARAVGTTFRPSASSCTSVSVAIASTSGTT